MYQERVDFAVVVREIKEQSATLSCTAIAREFFREYIDIYRGMESDSTLCRVARGVQRMDYGASQYYGQEENEFLIVDALRRLSDYVSSWDVVADHLMALLEVDEEVTTTEMAAFRGVRKRDTEAFLVAVIQFACKRPFYRRDPKTGQSTYYSEVERCKRLSVLWTTE